MAHYENLRRFNSATALKPWMTRGFTQRALAENALQLGHGIDAVDDDAKKLAQTLDGALAQT